METYNQNKNGSFYEGGVAENKPVGPLIGLLIIIIILVIGGIYFFNERVQKEDVGTGADTQTSVKPDDQSIDNMSSIDASLDTVKTDGVDADIQNFK